jgi:prophage antirepressor-like protein
MGIELDVLVGHHEHDLLFVATQVARASGLKHPKQAITDFRSLKGQPKPGLSMSLVREKLTSVPVDENGRSLRITTILFSESEVYKMLLRGHAPQSEPFRKWVTEEVLPTIRKTGKYDAEQSTNPIAMGLMERLKVLDDIVASNPELVAERVSTLLAETVTRSYEKSTRLAGSWPCRLSVGVP